MDMVMLLLVSAHRKCLRGKYGIGWQQHDAIYRFVMTMESSHANICTNSLKKMKAARLLVHY